MPIPDPFEVAAATNAIAKRPDAGNRRQKNGKQNGDDGDNCKQFCERESFVRFHNVSLA
jgi:hypothetical protein